MRAYPRPAYGPGALTAEQMQMWHYHINFSGNHKQSLAQAQAQYPGAGSMAAGGGESQGYQPGAQPQYQQPPYQQQPQYQYPQYQQPPQEQHQDDKKQGPDWMKLAGGAAAGGIALMGTKKLFEKFTEKPAHHGHH